jgi:polysaccharide lyase-like protein
MKQAKGVRAAMTAAALMLGGSHGFATVLFHNTGTTSGWNQILVEHNGSVSQVTSPVYKGSTAIKATQVYDPNWSLRYHSEVIRNDGYKPGQMRFYGFAFYLPANWQFVSQGFNISQFEADFASSCDGFMPTTMMWISSTSLSTRTKSGTVCNQVLQTYSGIASVTAGQWHRVVIQANWQSNTSGYFKVWYDGSKKLERFNIATTISDPANRTLQFRVGNYANGWYQKAMVGTQGTRSIYFDQIGIGTTFADADPNAW